MDDPLTPGTGEFALWVTELRQGRPERVEAVGRKVTARVETLVRAIFGQFHRLARFVDVDDVAQNVMIRMLRACRTVRPTSRRHFLALTGELIRREFLDLTRHYFGPQGDGANLADVVVGDGEREYAPEDQAAPGAAELELVAAFRRAVETLPAWEREVIVLAYYQGRPQAEIADLLQVSTRTVQRWQASAVALLRRALAPAE